VGDLILYTNPISRGRMARWVLEEIGQPYRTVILPYDSGLLQGADYRAINPMAKVPALRHGDAVVTEVAAICTYLADAFPDAGLAPAPRSADRAAYYRWLFFGAGPLEALLMDRFLGVTDIPHDKREMIGYGDYDRTMATLDAVVTAINETDRWLAGDSFTTADVYVGSLLIWGVGQGLIEDQPSFASYAKRLVARPAQVRASAKDDAIIDQAGLPGPA